MTWWASASECLEKGRQCEAAFNKSRRLEVVDEGRSTFNVQPRVETLDLRPELAEVRANSALASKASLVRW
jgi:hypothetical protein